jgi:hypothetical protein
MQISSEIIYVNSPVLTVTSRFLAFDIELQIITYIILDSVKFDDDSGLLFFNYMTIITIWRLCCSILFRFALMFIRLFLNFYSSRIPLF